MELKAIFAVKRENLTEQDKINLLDLEGKEFISDLAFRQSVRDALSGGKGYVHCLLGTVKEFIEYARKNADFNIDEFLTINVEINYEN